MGALAASAAAGGCAQMRKELKRLHRQLGTTFVYVTHDQEEALSLSGRIAVMQGGRIQQCGTPAEIYDRPANTFVASFFGSPAINLLEARIEREAGNACARIGDLRVALPEAAQAREGKVIAGIRPEHVRLSRKPLADGCAMRVALVEPHGGLGYAELETNELRLTAVAAASGNFQAGEQIWAALEAEKLHLFDSASGTRMQWAVQRGGTVSRPARRE
jgi:multiple sugar transport system ATP-binding protein